MKDIKIPEKRIRIELKWLLACFVLGFLLNAYSIIKFRTSWTELFTSLHFVLLMSLVLYVLLLFFRGLARLVLRFSAGKKND
jgi:hypothetical protein